MDSEARNVPPVAWQACGPTAAAPTSLDRLLALARAIDARDPNTAGHSEQVALYVAALAATLNLDAATSSALHTAALAHDIGMVAVPDWVLAKPAPLAEEELQLIRRHPVCGAEMLQAVGPFALEAAFVRHHHERWDGSGYPDGLVGQQIPRGARIIQIADCMDAMLMRRAYKAAYPIQRMLDELVRCAGHQFDPQIAAAAVRWAHLNEHKLTCRSDDSSA